MDASASSQDDFTVAELLESALPANKKVAEEARKAVSALVQQLKPILHYVTVPHKTLKGSEEHCSEAPKGPVQYKRHRVLQLARYQEGEATFALFLTEEGKFILAEECRKGLAETPHDHVKPIRNNQEAWEFFPFQKLTELLTNALDATAKKREEHVRSIKARVLKLKRIIRILQSPINEP